MATDHISDTTLPSSRMRLLAWSWLVLRLTTIQETLNYHYLRQFADTRP